VETDNGRGSIDMLELLVLIGLLAVGLLALKIVFGVLGLVFHLLLIPIKLVIGLIMFVVMLPFLILLLPVFLLCGVGFAVMGGFLLGIFGLFCPF